MAGGGKNKLEFIKQDTPKFLRDFKAKVGYKEGPTVDTKKQKIPTRNEDNDDDDGEREDEKPTICVLREGDLTEEEYNLHKAENDKQTDASSDGKIIFKAPLKRKIEPDNKKKVKGTKHADKGKKKDSSKVKKLDNTNLLSFAEDED